MIFGAIGCGNMGSAIINGVYKACVQLHDSDEIDGFGFIGYDHHEKNLSTLKDSCGMNACEDELSVAELADIILIGVKPYTVDSVLKKIAPMLTKDKLIISMAAGVSILRIKEAIEHACPVISIMPNTPVMVSEGCTALCFDDEILMEEQKNLVRKIFSKLGTSLVLKEEQLPQFSALAGSGPAFVFYMQEAMIEAAIRMGFPYDTAKELVDKIFLGSAKLAQAQSDESHAKLRLNVCSPKGSTIVGMNKLDKGNVRSGIIEGVLATYARALEMSKG